MNQESNTVLFYGPEWYVFSNFSSFAVEYAGALWPTSEHAYQAAKFTDEKIIDRIKRARSAHAAYKLAQELKPNARPNWNEIKLGVMEEIVRAKLRQHPYIQKNCSRPATKRLSRTRRKIRFGDGDRTRTAKIIWEKSG